MPIEIYKIVNAPSYLSTMFEMSTKNTYDMRDTSSELNDVWIKIF